MKASLAAIIAVASLSVISACSSAPAAPAATAEAQLAGPPAPTALAKPPASTTVPLTPELEALTKAARTQGYVPRNHNGTIVFCRTEPQIGTRLSSTSCISQADVANVVQRSIENRESVEAMQRKSLLQSQGN